MIWTIVKTEKIKDRMEERHPVPMQLTVIGSLLYFQLSFLLRHRISSSPV